MCTLNKMCLHMSVKNQRNWSDNCKQFTFAGAMKVIIVKGQSAFDVQNQTENTYLQSAQCLIYIKGAMNKIRMFIVFLLYINSFHTFKNEKKHKHKQKQNKTTLTTLQPRKIKTTNNTKHNYNYSACYCSFSFHFKTINKLNRPF